MAQYTLYEKVLEFGKTYNGYSPRYAAMGGANMALGGDLGSISGNPAGLGFYRKSEFGGSLSLNNSLMNTEWFNQTSAESRFFPALHNLAAVFDYTVDDMNENDWRGFTFGIGVHRTKSYQQDWSISQQFVSDQSELFLDVLTVNASYDPSTNFTQLRPISPNALLDIADGFSGGSFFDYQSALAFSSGLIFYDSVNTYYYPAEQDYDGFDFAIPYDILRENGDIEYLANQDIQVEMRGNQYQWDASFGANFRDELYLGAAIAIPTIRYSYSSSLTEEITAINGSPAFTGGPYAYEFEREFRGEGINLRGGFVYRPDAVFRLGAMIQTPTWYSVTETINESLSYNTNTADGTVSGAIPEFVRDISFRTPWRAEGGVAFFFKKYGFITADIGYLNFQSSNISLEDVAKEEEDTQNELLDQYGNPSAINVKVGGETRVDHLRFRAGFFYQSPTGNEDIGDRQVMQSAGTFGGSAGIGYITQNFHFDLTVLHRRTRQQYDPYINMFGLPAADLERRFTQIQLGGGYYF